MALNTWKEKKKKLDEPEKKPTANGWSKARLYNSSILFLFCDSLWSPLSFFNFIDVYFAIIDLIEIYIHCDALHFWHLYADKIVYFKRSEWEKKKKILCIMSNGKNPLSINRMKKTIFICINYCVRVFFLFAWFMVSFSWFIFEHLSECEFDHQMFDTPFFSHCHFQLNASLSIVVE